MCSSAPANRGAPTTNDFGYRSSNFLNKLVTNREKSEPEPMNTSFIVSADLRKTWVQYDLKNFCKGSPTRFHPKNGEGWFRVDLRAGWINRAEVLFIKPE